MDSNLSEKVACQAGEPDIYVGIGSNLGNRDENLKRAISAIQRTGLEMLGASSIYETEPVGFTKQPWFLNRVVRLGFSVTDRIKPISAAAVLDSLLAIERAMGRERELSGGPRIIDLDLLFYGAAVIDQTKSQQHGPSPVSFDPGSVESEAEVNLIVPHPRLHLRRFVLVPLFELAPDLVHPVLRKTVTELLELLTDKSTVRLYKG
jgi:2-amino-4-hydroxy-6-hydroxymethyldihydropteridine diphosphokinase